MLEIKCCAVCENFEIDGEAYCGVDGKKINNSVADMDNCSGYSDYFKEKK